MIYVIVNFLNNNIIKINVLKMKLIDSFRSFCQQKDRQLWTLNLERSSSPLKRLQLTKTDHFQA